MSSRKIDYLANSFVLHQSRHGFVAVMPRTTLHHLRVHRIALLRSTSSYAFFFPSPLGAAALKAGAVAGGQGRIESGQQGGPELQLGLALGATGSVALLPLLQR